MKFPPVDLFSFILGFCLGIIATIIVSRFRRLQPQLKAARENRIKKIQVSDIHECEQLYKNFMLRKCQHTHLASSLFSLNDIYTDLKLVGCPYYSDPDYYLENEPMVFQHFPISFGDPEGYADLPSPLLTLEQALEGGRNLVIMNEIGSGKTTLLAQYTSRILEGKTESEKSSSLLPVFINITELAFKNSDTSAFWDDLANLIHLNNNRINAENLKSILIHALDHSELILLLDGLDELTYENFQEAVNFTRAIIKNYPNIRIVLASGPNYAGGLYKVGFSPLSLQFPGTNQKAELIKSWIDGWNRLLIARGSTVKTYLLNSLWLLQDTKYSSMIELTQAIWTSLALDHLPGYGSYSLDYIQRSISGVLSFDSLIRLAEDIALSGNNKISHNEMVNIIKKDPITTQLLRESHSNAQGEDSSAVERDTQEINSIEDIINYLVEINLLVIRSKDALTFANPAVLCYLLACSKTYTVRDDWKYLLHSPMDSLILRYSQQQNKCLPGWIADDDPYLFRNLILAGQQMRSCKQDRVNYSGFARRLLPVILDDKVPMSTRLRLFKYFDIDTQSNMQLLERLMNHPSRIVRQLVALNLGRQKSAHDVMLLKTLLGDQDMNVRMAASLSLYQIFDGESIDLLADILLNGKDNLCIFIAEILAFKPGQGHAILKELLETGNIISKKAAISGLRLIDEKWADDLLQKVSTTDEQWFVRDAAAHALESKWNNKYYIPSKRQEPSEASWLIKFASQAGYSVPAGVYPYVLLYRLIDSGTLEERLLSLAYLTDKPDEHTISKLKEIMESDSPLREESAHLFGQLHQQK